MFFQIFHISAQVISQSGLFFSFTPPKLLLKLKNPIQQLAQNNGINPRIPSDWLQPSLIS